MWAPNIPTRPFGARWGCWMGGGEKRGFAVGGRGVQWGWGGGRAGGCAGGRGRFSGEVREYVKGGKTGGGWVYVVSPGWVCGDECVKQWAGCLALSVSRGFKNGITVLRSLSGMWMCARQRECAVRQSLCVDVWVSISAWGLNYITLSGSRG